MTRTQSFRRVRCYFVCNLFFGLLACYAPQIGHAQRHHDSYGEPAPAYTSQFFESECPPVVRASIDAQSLTGVQCGFVEVPENYRSSYTNPKTLRSFVLIARTQSAHPRTPVFFLTGGPGQSLSSIAGQVLTSGVTGQLRLQRDIVLIDPRGVGQSEPRLTCPAPATPAEPAASAGQDVLTPAQREAVRCADVLLAQGVDLAAYNTINLARDVNSIRVALKLPKIVIYGVSYGAFLGLQTLRHAKKWIESAVLVSIPRPFGGTMVRSGQTAQAAVDTLARMCAEQPACAAYGDLSANLDALLTRLTAQPLDLGPSVPVQLTADLLGVFIQQALDNPLAASTFPKAVEGALNGETELWLPRVQAFLAQPAFDPDLVVSIPMHNSVWCSEELVIGSPEELQARAADSSRLVKRTALPPALAAYETCAVWPVPTAPAWFFGPVVSDIPTYLISGALDPVTAPDFARVALRHLSNGQLTIIAAAGHLASENSPCAPQLVEQFLEAPYAPIEDSCTAAPVPFVP